MMQWLKQSTAANIQLGPFVDEDDGKTAETGLTIAQADIRLSKNGANIAQSNNAAGATHDELGYYVVPLDTTDTNTLGRLLLAVHESGALPVWREFMVLPANEYDSLVLGTDALEVNVTEVEGADPTDTIRDAVVDDATRIDASSVNAVEGKLDTVDGIVDDILADTGELQVDDTPAALAAIDGKIDTIDGIVDDILADTGELQVDDTPAALAAIDAKIDTADTVVDAIKAVTDNLPDAGALSDLATILADTNELQTDDIPTTLATIAGYIDTEISATITHLTDLKGTDFVKDTDSMVDLAHIGADGDTLETLSDQIDDTVTLGTGATTFTYTLTSTVDSAVISDAQVWVTTDQAGTNVVASGTTDDNGQVTFYLDAATYYIFRQKSGWSFDNPDTEVVA